MGHGLTTAALLFIALGAAAPERAGGERMSLPDHCLGLRMQPLLLLTRADVRADLGLDEGQAEQVDKAVLEFVPRAAEARRIAGPAGVDARRVVDADAQRWLETHLNEKQYQRLIQVDLQWEGPSALVSRPIVADHLELTGEQRQALLQAVAVRNKQRPPGTFRQDVEKALAEQALKVLTPKQQSLWAAMLGPYFTPRFAEPPRSAARPTE
jgi:hypothetical protein